MNESHNDASGKKVKVAFFAKQGLDGFIDTVIDGLNGWFEMEKIVVTDLKQIDAGMEWADVCWFEWCDELVIYASRHVKAAAKKIICRLHSYEAFTDYPNEVNWEMVDLLVFVAGHIRDIVADKVRIGIRKSVVVPNGVDTRRFSFKQRAPGHNIAFAGYISSKKAPVLLLHTFKAIHDTDNRYKLHLAGLFQDERDLLYFQQMIREWGLEENVIFEGWQEDLDAWLEDKNYILCTSILEAEDMSVIQAMAKGIKPIIHNFVGAKSIYPQHLVFNTIPEAVAMLHGAYDSDGYRQFVQSNYSTDETAKQMRQAIRNVADSGEKLPLVSVVMAVYNREKYVRQAMESVLSQNYENIELIVVNDGSTDNSERVILSVEDHRVRYFAREYTGPLSALAHGFRMSNGKFATRVDSDDCIHPDYIAACVEAMLLDPWLDFVYSDFLTIDDKGKPVGEIHFKDYGSPLNLILDAFTTFSSVIPDTAFWRKEYMEHVMFNYTRENVPFYADNILECRYGHIKNPMYHYRQHDTNYAAEPGNLKAVMEGKVRFIDILINKYFIQMDVTDEFRENRQEYFRLFVQYFTVLGQAYENAGKEITGLFADEAAFWKMFTKPENGHGKEEAVPEGSGMAPVRVRNRRILLVSTDGPRQDKAMSGKHMHIQLLMKGLDELMIPFFFVVYAFDPVNIVDESMLAKDWGASGSLLASRDSAFVYLVYAIQKQIERGIEKRLKASFVSSISCQDVIAVHAARNVMSRMHIEIPMITTLHGFFTFENTDFGLINENGAVYDFFLEYEKTAYAVSDRIIAVDARIRDYVLGMMGNAAQKTTVLKNALNDDLFQTDPEEEGFFNDNIVLFPGRIQPENVAMQAVKTASELKKRGVTGFTFVIAGNETRRKEIEEYAVEHGLQEHVKLLGDVPYDRMIPLYQAARAVVIPLEPSGNAEEAAPRTALEAMACGRIVVASRTGGLEEIIEDGKNGYLVQPADPAALADAIARVLNIDIETYLAIARNARRMIEEEYGYRRHTQKYVAVFDGCFREMIAGTAI